MFNEFAMIWDAYKTHIKKRWKMLKMNNTRERVEYILAPSRDPDIVIGQIRIWFGEMLMDHEPPTVVPGKKIPGCNKLKLNKDHTRLLWLTDAGYWLDLGPKAISEYNIWIVENMILGDADGKGKS